MIEDQLFELTLNKQGKVAKWLVENLMVTGSDADLLAAGEILAALSHVVPPDHGQKWEGHNKNDVMRLAEKVVPFWFLVNTVYRTRTAGRPEKVYIGVKLEKRDQAEGSRYFTYIDPPCMELSGLNKYCGPYSPEYDGRFGGGTIGRFMFLCPECGEGRSSTYSGVNGLHVGAARVAPWQIALFCDGHEITLVVSGRGYRLPIGGQGANDPRPLQYSRRHPLVATSCCDSCGNLVYAKWDADLNIPRAVCHECRDTQD